MKVNLKAKKTKIILIVVVIVAILAVLIGRAISKMASTVETAMNLVQVETVERRDLSEAISLTGTAAGISRTNVTSKAAAEVTGVNVQVGDQVKAGDVLCQFDTAEIEEQIALTEKTLSNESAVASNTSKQNAQALEDAKAEQTQQLSEAQTAISQAEEDYNAESAKLAGTISSRDAKNAEIAEAATKFEEAKNACASNPGDENLAQTYEEAKADLQTKQSELAALEQSIAASEETLKAHERAIASAKSTYGSTKTATDKAISSAQNVVDMETYQNIDNTTEKALADLQEQLADCEVKAPCDGVVTAVNLSVGDTNTPNTVIVSIEDTSSMKINAIVSEDDILKLEEGMKAVVMTGATGDEEIEGTVTRVVKVKNESTGTGAEAAATSGYAAEITVKNSKLLVGMSAKVKVIIQEKKNTLAVPYDLIQFDEDGNSYVLLAEEQEDGTYSAVRCPVSTGEEVDYYTEITGGDLKEGDRLIYDTSIMEGEIFSANQMYSGEETDQLTDGTMEDAE